MCVYRCVCLHMYVHMCTYIETYRYTCIIVLEINVYLLCRSLHWDTSVSEEGELYYLTDVGIESRSVARNSNGPSDFLL